MTSAETLADGAMAYIDPSRYPHLASVAEQVANETPEAATPEELVESVLSRVESYLAETATKGVQPDILA